MITSRMSESASALNDAKTSKAILEKFERAKILEVYFSRIDGRIPENISSDYHELYDVKLDDMKSFLLGQHPQDTILHRIFRMMS